MYIVSMYLLSLSILGLGDNNEHPVRIDFTELSMISLSSLLFANQLIIIFVQLFLFYFYIFMSQLFCFIETNRAMFDAKILHKQKAFSEEEQLPDDGSGGLSVIKKSSFYHCPNQH